MYATFICISCSHCCNSFVLITRRLVKSWQAGAALLLLLLFLPAPREADNLSTTRISMAISAPYRTITMIVEMAVQNSMTSLFGDHPARPWASSHQKICSRQQLENESQQLNWLYLRISNTVAHRDPENSRLAVGQRQIYMPHKRSWGAFKVPFLFHHRLDDQLRSASFDLQRLELWILFTGHTSMAYDKWEWKIDHWLIKSTQHSLPSPQWPSTIVCRPGQEASLWSRRSLVQEVEHNVHAIQETLIIQFIMHEQMYFIVSTQIFIFPHPRFKPTRSTISAAWFAKASTQVVWSQRWHNLTTIRGALMRTFFITSWRTW